MAAASGQWLNYSKLASDTEVAKETIRRFVQLLDDTLLAVRIAPYRPGRGVTRRVLQRERVLLFDVGVRNALLDIHRRAPSADRAGAVFEQWVILQIVYLGRALEKGWKLTSYRSEAGAEVDLVVEREADAVAIEIKYGRNVAKTDTRGLLSLRQIATGRKPLRHGFSTAASGGRSSTTASMSGPCSRDCGRSPTCKHSPPVVSRS